MRNRCLSISPNIPNITAVSSSISTAEPTFPWGMSTFAKYNKQRSDKYSDDVGLRGRRLFYLPILSATGFTLCLLIIMYVIRPCSGCDHEETKSEGANEITTFGRITLETMGSLHDQKQMNVLSGKNIKNRSWNEFHV